MKALYGPRAPFYAQVARRIGDPHVRAVSCVGHGNHVHP